jgi:hypothetical protein
MHFCLQDKGQFLVLKFFQKLLINFMSIRSYVKKQFFSLLLMVNDNGEHLLFTAPLN